MKRKTNAIVRTSVMALALTFAAAPIYAFAAIDKATVISFISSAVEIIFNLISAAIAVIGAIQLIPGIVHFVQSMNSGNGEQRKEAANGIGTAVILLLFAGMIFMLKNPIDTLIQGI